MSEELLVDLTNHGLVSDGIQHEVKRHHRGARRAGSGVDRAYHLMELLDHGDHARWQRDQGLEQGRYLARVAHAQWLTQAELVEQGAGAHEQRETLLRLADDQTVGIGELVEQGEHAMTQRRVQAGIASAHLAADIGIGRETHRHLGVLEEVGREGNAYLETVAGNTAALIEEGRVGNWHLERISDSLIGTNVHLVNLKDLGEKFIETMGEGFEEVATLLRDGFAMQEEALAKLIFEVALTRAEVVGRLESLEETVRVVGLDIQREITRTNALLAEFLDVTKHPRRTRARERLNQAADILKVARERIDFQDAHRLLSEAAQDDPTIMEAQYGAATTAEALGDLETAETRYGIVGKRSKPDQNELAAAAWQRVAILRERAGRLPAAIESLRSALERENENQARWMLARALGRAGFATEAIELLAEFVNEDPENVYQIQYDPAFESLPLRNFYIDLFRKKIVRRGAILLSIAHELTLFGALDEAFEIIQSFIDLGPVEALFDIGISESTLWNKIRDRVEAYLKQISTQPDRPQSAGIWYAQAFLLLQLNCLEEALTTLRNGLAQDPRFYHRQGQEIVAAWEGISPNLSTKLRGVIEAQAKDLLWLFQKSLRK